MIITIYETRPVRGMSSYTYSRGALCELNIGICGEDARKSTFSNYSNEMKNNE